jgi:maltooligosyltrehalose trehalohydrolase
VELVLLDGERRRQLPMAVEALGYHSRSEVGIAEGQRYAYRLDNGSERPDPASLWQPEGIHRPSAVLFPERYHWSDQGWSGVAREDLVFYELHVGTFTPEGTFDAVIGRLDSLRDLGVTAIELMPIAQFPGARNWGYDGVHPYAVQSSYGGPHGLHRLVDASHARGLAIFLDVVYNHVGPEGNYLNEYGPYFADRYRTSWGPAFNYDSAGSDAVRAFILNNVRLWIGAYHLDGLRLDAVHAIHDTSPCHILRAIKETADELASRQRRRVEVFAESDLNDARLMQPPERGGYGLDGQWSDDFHHTVHAYLTGERQSYYTDFGQAGHFAKVLQDAFVLDGTYSRHRNRRHGAPAGDLSGDRFVISIQNHDQVGNRARGDRLGHLLSPPAQRLAASLLLLAPYVPLVFMGEEYGETQPFLFFCSFFSHNLIRNVREGRRREFAAFAWQGEVPDPQDEATFRASRLSWSWPSETHQAGLRRLYQDLLRVRRRWPALRDFLQRRAQLLGQGAVLELVRGSSLPAAGQTLQAHFNLTGEVQPLSRMDEVRQAWLFSSEAKHYRGARGEADSRQQLLPHECVVRGPQDWERLL